MAQRKTLTFGKYEEESSEDELFTQCSELEEDVMPYGNGFIILLTVIRHPIVRALTYASK
jgi:hypothetical protein